MPWSSPAGWNTDAWSAPAAAVAKAISFGAAQTVNGFFPGGTGVTFNNMNGGANYASAGLVVIGLVQDQSYTPGATNDPVLSIGGTPMTKVSGTDDGSLRSSLWQATVSAGNSDTLVVTPATPAPFLSIGVAPVFMTGLSSTVATAAGALAYGGGTDPEGFTTPFSVSSGGFGLILFGTTNAVTSGTTLTYTNTTNSAGDSNSNISTKVQIGMAHTITAGAWNPTVSGSPTIVSFSSSLSGAAWT